MSIQLQQEGRLARIILSRPPLNILDLAHLDELVRCVMDAQDAAVLVLQAGEGCRCFSAGNAIQDHVPDRAPEMLMRFHRAIRALLESPAVTVADVRGDALGGGCELVTVCDLVYATPESRFGQPEIKVGCYPPAARPTWVRAGARLLAVLIVGGIGLGIAAAHAPDAAPADDNPYGSYGRR